MWPSVTANPLIDIQKEEIPERTMMSLPWGVNPYRRREKTQSSAHPHSLPDGYDAAVTCHAAFSITDIM